VQGGGDAARRRQSGLGGAALDRRPPGQAHRARGQALQTACRYASHDLRDIVGQQAECIMPGHWTKHAEMAAVKRRDDIGAELARENHVHGVGQRDRRVIIEHFMSRET
jgi:hypothetical protein